jgi:AAA15 family ATPase/GTPase
MLCNFTVSNFRSFADQMNLFLCANKYEKSLPENLIKYEASNDNYLSSVAVYGGNATGKTNLFAAMSEVCKFVTDSYKSDPTESPITFAQPFKSRSVCLENPSRFTIEFIADGVQFFYLLALTSERIVSEALIDKTKKKKCWFGREWNKDSQKYEWEFPNRDTRKGLQSIANRTRPNVSFLSKAVDDNNVPFQVPYNWFAKSIQFINHDDNPLSPDGTIERLRSPEKSKLIITLLRNAGFDILGARLDDFNNGHVTVVTDIQSDSIAKDIVTTFSLPAFKIQFTSYPVSLIHKAVAIGDETNVILDFDKESTGLQHYFCFLGYWLDALENGNVLVVDDLDMALHPLLIRQIIQLFNSKANTKGAQLIFSARNPLFQIEQLLRYDQIWFTDRLEDDSTRLCQMSRYSKLDKKSFMDNYMSGLCGGAPQVDLFIHYLWCIGKYQG